ncbi:MAG: glycosyl hydrolase family 18 protein, partial [Candidatus Limnocylindrales bacterium]
SDDTWTVGGGRPLSLPPGLATGKAMAQAAQGSSWTAAPPAGFRDAGPVAADAPIDGAIGPATAATTTAYEAPAATDPTLSPGATINPTGLRREVFGFLPYWELSASSTTLDYSVLSTIAYFSVGADKDGNLMKQTSTGAATTGWGGWTSSKMTSVVNAAHQRGTRVVLTISCFAWTTGQQSTQAALLGSPTARTNLAKQIAAAVRDRGADGVNLDFEPIVSTYDDEFTALVRGVRTALDAVAPGYQVTFDTTGYIGNYPLANATAPGGADAIFIMGYDYRTSSSSQAGSISPLAGPPYDLTDTVAAYAANVSPSKLILGVPYYGRAWSTDSSALHATNVSGTKYGSSVTSVYETAADLASQYGRLYDSTEQAPWTAYQRENCTTTYGCVTTWRELYYDDAASLKLRYDLVNRTGLRGAGIWALGYDGTRRELYGALADKFLNDTTPPVVGVNALPVTQHDLGFRVAWSGNDESTIVSWDVQAARDGGAWADWRTGTTALSGTFLGADGHAYAFRVRGKDGHGNVSAWAVTSSSTMATLAVGGFGTVLVDGLKLRAAPGTTAGILTTLSAGDALAITGGPTSADGYDWYQVTGPVRQWSPVDPVQVGGWVAAGTSGDPYLAPRMPINTTRVDPVISAYSVGTGTSRTVTPNGDGLSDGMPIHWTSSTTFESMSLRVVRADGSVAGTKALTATGSGAQGATWDGMVGGAVVPDGSYVLQLIGMKGVAVYNAPSASPASPEQLAAFAVTVDHLPVTRLGGADRYATAVAVSRATFAPGVPVVYLATGSGYADALAGAPVAGMQKGPILLVTSTAIPAVVATELSRLKPARIVILGGTSVVSSQAASDAESDGGG